jgi:plasmid stability protein
LTEQKNAKTKPDSRKTLTIDGEVHTKLKVASALSGKSIEGLATEILKSYLDEQWKKLLKQSE